MLLYVEGSQGSGPAWLGKLIKKAVSPSLTNRGDVFYLFALTPIDFPSFEIWRSSLERR